MKISAILLAGGKGTRMGATTPKQFLSLAGKAVALHSFCLFQQSPLISEIIVVCSSSYEHLFPNARFANPGDKRQDSLFSALNHISSDSDLILVHDAARPLLKNEDLENVIHAATEIGASTLAVPIKVTIKQADTNQMVLQTLDRTTLYDIQTPQVMKKEILLKGFAKAHQENLTVTDDVSLAEIIGRPVKLVIGSYDNIKITTPEDLTFAENILHEQNPALHL